MHKYPPKKSVDMLINSFWFIIEIIIYKQKINFQRSRHCNTYLKVSIISSR